jgi:hypothetical protein
LQYNAVTFRDVPVDPPGANASRTFRIVNVRANAAAIGIGVGFFTSLVVGAIAINGSVAPSLTNPQQVLGYLNAGIMSDPSGLGDFPSVIRIQEAFAGSWRMKNLSFTVGDNTGTVGNGTYQRNLDTWVYNGGARYPVDVAQK